MEEFTTSTILTGQLLGTDLIEVRRYMYISCSFTSVDSGSFRWVIYSY